MSSYNEKNMKIASSVQDNTVKSGSFSQGDNVTKEKYSILDRLYAYKRLSSEKAKIVDMLYRLDTALGKNRNECEHELFIFYNEFKCDKPYEAGVFYGDMYCPLCGERFAHIVQEAKDGKLFMIDATKLNKPRVAPQKCELVSESYTQLAEELFEKEGRDTWSDCGNEKILKRLEEIIGIPYYRVKIVR